MTHTVIDLFDYWTRSETHTAEGPSLLKCKVMSRLANQRPCSAKDL